MVFLATGFAFFGFGRATGVRLTHGFIGLGRHGLLPVNWIIGGCGMYGGGGPGRRTPLINGEVIPLITMGFGAAGGFGNGFLGAGFLALAGFGGHGLYGDGTHGLPKGICIGIGIGCGIGIGIGCGIGIGIGCGIGIGIGIGMGGAIGIGGAMP